MYKKIKKCSNSYIILGVFLWTFVPQSLLAQSPRNRECFDFNWMFHLGDIRIERAVKAGQYGGLTDIGIKTERMADADIAYSDKDKAELYNPKDWRKVDLPHDWCVEGKFINDKSRVIDGAPEGLVSHGFLPVGIGFYRKEFSIPKSDEGKKITLEFDGIFRNSTVWVNGHLMGNHLSGYTPSFYDLSDVLRYGDEGQNVVLVKVDAREYEGWWYEGCGIYRHVWLLKTDRLHVGRYGTYVSTPEISEENASVRIKTTVANEYNTPRKLKIISEIQDLHGNTLDTRENMLEIGALDEACVEQTGNVSDPLLWSPETPNLYKVATSLVHEGKTVDKYETTFGIRTAEIRKDGFYLNGKPYHIKGTANHQDFAGVGVAVPDKIHEYRIKLLKEMGCNAYRTAHNPTATEVMDICDREGMLFLDENRILSSTKEGLEDLKTLILRDRNHPSVFMWCLENEEPLEGSATGRRILQTMVDVVRNLDSTRQITAAMNHGWNENGYSDVVDVVGYNYGQRNMQYVKDKEQYPERLMLMTETSSFVSTRGEYADNFSKGIVSNMGNGVGWGMLPGTDWHHVVKYPYLSGMFAWTGFDYRGEPTPIYKWPTVVSHFGIMDLCGFPKDSYYAYKAAWTDEPVLHVFPHWNWPDKIGKEIDIMGYTNCDEVELSINGKSLGRRKTKPYERLKWSAIYQPGKVVAKGWRNGKIVIKKTIETTDTASKLSIVSSDNYLKADGKDVAILNISVKDSKGRVVPTADNLIRFSIEGPGIIIGTGNGNPNSHEPDKSNCRKAFNGYCQVIVQTKQEAGEIQLKAESDGLKPAIVRLETKL